MILRIIKFLLILIQSLFNNSSVIKNNNQIIDSNIGIRLDGDKKCVKNVVYDIYCTVTPSNHTADVIWESNYSGYVKIVDYDNYHCSIMRIADYAHGIGNYVTISAKIDGLVAYCYIYEDKSDFNESSLELGICKNYGGQDTVDLYIRSNIDLMHSVEIYWVGLSNAWDGRYNVVDYIELHPQDRYVYIGSFDWCEYWDSLEDNPSFDDSDWYGFYVEMEVIYNDNEYYFEFDYY